MTDLRFNDVVSNVNYDYKKINTTSSRRKANKCKALCSTCGKYHTACSSEGNEDELMPGFGKDVLKYVATMRAWNCCHEGAEPHDGFPEPPNHPLISDSDVVEDK